MDIWKRSWFYRLWVVGGIAAIVLVNVAWGLSAEPGETTSVTPALAMVAVWVAGFLALSWHRVLADRRDGAYGFGAGLAVAPGGDGPPASFGALVRALAVEPLGAREAERAADATWDFTRNGFAVLTFGVVAIMVAMGLYVTGTLGAEAAILPLLVLIAAAALRVPFQARRAMEVGDAWLAPLHLRMTGLPQPMLDPSDGEGVRVLGATSFGGTRHGRIVSAEVAATGSVVAVTGAVEPFRAVSDAERLEVVEGPPWAAMALAGAGRDPRWRQVDVRGGPNGIVVRRRGSTAEGTVWLADLWLAERLAAAAPKAYAA